ncbi:zinc ribbon domain-containing protein [Tepidiforma sp.]|uniref:FmdB family zinc ribbon protein n=1 Tax=Tepidiforma sp. TaxID=2682230 RepID=UPI00260A15EB|nr:zinc ribbon domain-containing protein [Tepidiforma sp.]MCX7618665.1 zinc ribbon domain-containing protein [Tepidiforma sp.]
MPLYDYRCDRCGLEFEVSRSIKDSDIPADCPMCSVPAKRLFTPPMMTFTRGAARESLGTPAPPAGGSRWSHHGHSHGPGTRPHSH